MIAVVHHGVGSHWDLRQITITTNGTNFEILGTIEARLKVKQYYNLQNVYNLLGILSQNIQNCGFIL